jgi:Eukaryotic protein of unknown function (DUF829)
MKLLFVRNVVPKPKVIVIVLGHLGVTETQLKLYTSFYTKYHYCATIGASCPTFRFLLNQTLSISCHQILHHVLDLLQQHDPTIHQNFPASYYIMDNTTGSIPVQMTSTTTGSTTDMIITTSNTTTNNNVTTKQPSIPIIIHSMSNGGAFLLEEMEKILLSNQATNEYDKDKNSKNESNNRDPTTYKRNRRNHNNKKNEISVSSFTKEEKLILIHRIRQGVQIFDSCPCYIRTIWSQEYSIPTSYIPSDQQAFPYPTWSKSFRRIYTTFATVSLSLWCFVTFAWDRPKQFWSHMLHSPLGQHQIFVYTTTDLLSDAHAVQQLIEYRKSVLKIHDIQVFPFNDSGHCQLHIDHPEQYDQIIHDAIDAAVQRASSEHVKKSF